VRHRIVIAPLGLPSEPAAEERCAELLLRCGADLGRVFEADPERLGPFANHLAQIRELREGSLHVLAVMCQSLPLARMTATRQALEARIPSLAKAAWVIFADPSREPSCLEEIASEGTLNGAVWEAPEWKTPEGQRYLFLIPRLPRHVESDLSVRIRKLTQPESSKSGRVLRPIDGARPAATPTLPEIPALKSA